MEEQSKENKRKKENREKIDKIVEEGMARLKEDTYTGSTSVLTPPPGRINASSGGAFTSLRSKNDLGLREGPDPRDPATMPGEVIVRKPAQNPTNPADTK